MDKNDPTLPIAIYYDKMEQFFGSAFIKATRVVSDSSLPLIVCELYIIIIIILMTRLGQEFRTLRRGQVGGYD